MKKRVGTWWGVRKGADESDKIWIMVTQTWCALLLDFEWVIYVVYDPQLYTNNLCKVKQTATEVLGPLFSSVFSIRVEHFDGFRQRDGNSLGVLTFFVLWKASSGSVVSSRSCTPEAWIHGYVFHCRDFQHSIRLALPSIDISGGTTQNMHFVVHTTG